MKRGRRLSEAGAGADRTTLLPGASAAAMETPPRSRLSQTVDVMLNGNIGDPADVQHLGHKASDTAAPSKDDVPRQATTGFGHDGFIRLGCRTGGAKVGQPGQDPVPLDQQGCQRHAQDNGDQNHLPYVRRDKRCRERLGDQQKGELAGMGQDKTTTERRGCTPAHDPRHSADDGRLQGHKGGQG